MKKAIKFFGLFAVAAMTVISCSKEAGLQTPEEPVIDSSLTHTVTIKVTDADTKTVINEGVSSASFVWSSDDNTRFYLTETGKAANSISISSSDEYATIKLSATFTQDSTPAEYTYAGFMSKNKTNNTPKKPRVPATQTCTGSSYDPDADVLVAKPLTFNVAQDELEMQFARPVVINKMTLKGLGEGETLSKVTISANKNFMGYYDPSTSTWTYDGAEVVVNTSQVVTASGQVVVWFVTAPVEAATLTVVAETEDYTYSKTFGSTINFVQNQVTRFGVNSLTKAPKVDYSGDYLIGSYSGGTWHLMSSTVNASNYYERTETSVTKAFASVAASDFAEAGITTNDYCWKVEADGTGYSIKSYKTNKYVSLTVNDNKATAADDLDDVNHSTNFSFSTSGDITTITSKRFSTRYLRYNSGSPRFAFYASSGSNICLIPCTYDPRIAVTLSFAEDALAYDTDDYGDCTGQVASASPSVSAITSNITYALTGDAIGTVNASTGVVSLNGSTGTATITASFSGDEDYLPAEKSYTIMVTTAGAATYHYEALTEAPTDWTAETYIIVSGTAVLDGGVASGWGTKIDVTIESDGSIKETAAITKCEVTVAGNSTDGYTLYLANADSPVYIKALASKSFATESPATTAVDLATDSISYHENTDWKLRLNGQYRWYSSNTGSLAVLYKKVEDQD